MRARASPGPRISCDALLALAILELALEFASASPALPDDESWKADEAPSWLEDRTDLLDEEDWSWIGIPPVRWDAPAALAAANAISTTAGKALLCDVLILAHPTPAFWAAVRAGRVPAHRARRVAQALLGQPSGPSSSTGWSTRPCSASTPSNASSSSSRHSTPAT